MTPTAASEPILSGRPIAEGLFSWPAERPQLIGSRCEKCGAKTFPAQGHCPRCASTSMAEVPPAPHRLALDVDDPGIPSQVSTVQG